MPAWTPSPIWQGQDAFIVGGGSSLRGFDFSLLKGRAVIGCNHAFLLGAEIIKVCAFGDISFWNGYKDRVKEYKGMVITNSPRLHSCTEPWLFWLPRQAKGLYTECLGWNGNMGAMAINLALIFGAKRIFLLGYDMWRDRDNVHWHDENNPKIKMDTYATFIPHYRDVVRDLKEKFSDRLVVNVNDNTALKCFPIYPLQGFFSKGGAYETVDFNASSVLAPGIMHGDREEIRCRKTG